ncbi:hypothetical protein D7X87_20620 [bacterium D16-54]|nr:hypothetical protein D7X87_20620 [bacterium D16-54]RKJ11721.1 hypothetical protein D7X65_21055 [bacterium D16-56]
MKFKLTDLGKWMEAQLLAGSKPIITKIEASDAYSSNEGALLSVQNKKQDLEIQEIAVIDGASHLKFVLHNVGLTEGYMLRQIGIYAKQTEESEEILYIIGQDKTGERVPASNEKQVEYEYDLMIHTENTYEANVVVKGSYFATKGEMEELDGKKVDASGGNISDTKVSEFETREDVFPEPQEGDTQKTLWGKIKKFVEDFRDWYTGVCLIGHIVNNCTSNASNLPLSAAQGKVLMDLYTKLNSDFNNPNNLKSYDYSTKIFDFDDFKHEPGMYRLGNKNYILNPPASGIQYANVLITRNINTDTASAFVFPYEDSIIHFRNGNPVSWIDRPWRKIVTDANMVKTKVCSYNVTTTEMSSAGSSFSNYGEKIVLSEQSDFPDGFVSALCMGVFYRTSGARLGIGGVVDKTVFINTNSPGEYYVRILYFYI